MKKEIKGITSFANDDLAQFTVIFTTVTNSIIFPVDVFPDVVMKPHAGSGGAKLSALWDTGASDNCISRRAAHHFRLISGAEFERGSISRPVLITVMLPNNRPVPLECRVMDNLPKDIHLVIGGTIFTRGSYQLKNMGSYSFFTFAEPLSRDNLSRSSGLELPEHTSVDRTSTAFKLTLHYRCIVDKYIFRCELGKGGSVNSLEKMDSIGIIDTGAEVSFISGRVSQQLRLKTMSGAPVNTSAGSSFSKMSVIDLILDKDFRYSLPVLIDERLDERFDFLLGMDVLKLGLFDVVNEDNSTKICLNVPRQVLPK